MKHKILVTNQDSYWLELAVWATVTFLVFQGVAVAEGFAPRPSDYHRFAKISDCTVYRSVLAESQSKLREQEQALQDVLALTQSSRKALESCASDNGVTRLDTEQQEVEAAFLCLESYEEWLRRGISLEVVRQDVSSAMKDVDQLLGVLASSCSPVTIASNP